MESRRRPQPERAVVTSQILTTNVVIARECLGGVSSSLAPMAFLPELVRFIEMKENIWTVLNAYPMFSSFMKEHCAIGKQRQALVTSNHPLWFNVTALTLWPSPQEEILTALSVF